MLPDANSCMWVGRILIFQTETERPTSALLASLSLPDCWKRDEKAKCLRAWAKCHVIVSFITRHYTGFLVRFATDFVLLEVRFNPSTCDNC